MTARTPTSATLRKYGLTAAEWEAILANQGGVCGICVKVPASGRLCTDHEHVPGWKKMPPEERKLYVRGLACFWCNRHYLARGMTPARARNVEHYLREYELRRPPCPSARPKKKVSKRSPRP